jgi:hypothetical protein
MACYGGRFTFSSTAQYTTGLRRTRLPCRYATIVAHCIHQRHLSCKEQYSCGLCLVGSIVSASGRETTVGTLQLYTRLSVLRQLILLEMQTNYMGCPWCASKWRSNRIIDCHVLITIVHSATRNGVENDIYSSLFCSFRMYHATFRSLLLSLLSLFFTSTAFILFFAYL